MEIAVATWSCFRELEPGVKWILSDLLDIAAERGNCKESPEGERYLDGIPMEELCHTMIAALNVTKMKHYAAQVQTLTACSRTAAEIVKNGIRIMLSLYLEPYETEPGKTERRVKIVGGEKRSAEERVSSFYAVALYKYLYEKTEDQAAWKQFKEEYLEIPYYVNLYRIQGRTTGGGKQKYTEQYIQQWEAQMRGFLQEEQKKGVRYGYFENMDLDHMLVGFRKFRLNETFIGEEKKFILTRGLSGVYSLSYYLSEEDRMEVDYYPREDKLLLFKPRSEDGYTFMLEK